MKVTGRALARSFISRFRATGCAVLFVLFSGVNPSLANKAKAQPTAHRYTVPQKVTHNSTRLKLIYSDKNTELELLHKIHDLVLEIGREEIDLFVLSNGSGIMRNRWFHLVLDVLYDRVSKGMKGVKCGIFLGCNGGGAIPLIDPSKGMDPEKAIRVARDEVDAARKAVDGQNCLELLSKTAEELKSENRKVRTLVFIVATEWNYGPKDYDDMPQAVESLESLLAQGVKQVCLIQLQEGDGNQDLQNKVIQPIKEFGEKKAKLNGGKKVITTINLRLKKISRDNAEKRGEDLKKELRKKLSTLKGLDS